MRNIQKKRQKRLRQEEFKKVISRLGKVPVIGKRILDSIDFVKNIIENQKEEKISEELDEVFKKHFKMKTSLKKQKKAYELMKVEMPKISQYISWKIKRCNVSHQER